MLLRVMLIPLFPIPEPRYHDEFSFLLGADTLLHGRVSNPVHPMWVHFESMHILTCPFYMSAFPLGQAAVLAIGILLGHPWIGVLLSCGLMCGAMCWMLQGWMPPSWALLGALLAVMRFGVSGYWMNTYWGGALAATGGALVLGAMPRILRQPHWRHSIMMGIGFMVLANTRTFEGAIFCSLVLTATLLGLVRKKIFPARSVILPLALMALATVAGLLFYFALATGDSLQPPYVLYRKSLSVVPHFLFQGVRPEPRYNNRDLRHFFTGLEMHVFLAARQNLAGDIITKVASYWRFYVGPLLSIPLMAMLLVPRRSRARQLLLLGAMFSVALIPQVWHNSHYAAPATGLILLSIMVGMRMLRLRRPGLCLVRILPFACAAFVLVQIFAGNAIDDGTSTTTSGWRWPDYGGRERAGILRELQKMEGGQLVLVRYGPRHDAGNEWVYNRADIDGSKVVWARELNRDSNLRLFDYFKGRRVWLVEPDLAAPRLIPYEHAQERPMLFIPPGAPGIESLRSIEEVRSRMAVAASGKGSGLLTCDQWNFYYTQITGVFGPDPVKGCFEGGGRTQRVSFERYFNWMLDMR